jgi:hypothetical protein
MVKSDRDLDQTLQKLLFWFWRSAPNVFQHFVGVKKRTPIKESDALTIQLRMGNWLWHAS